MSDQKVNTLEIEELENLFLQSIKKSSRYKSFDGLE